MITAIGFDLDNTLFDQSAFMFAFFAFIAKEMEARAQIDASRVEAAFRKVLAEKTSFYNKLFDDAISAIGLSPEREVPWILSVFRRFEAPQLAPYPAVRSVLADLSSRYRLFLVTDGHGTVQRGKLRALSLPDVLDPIIVTGELGPGRAKPSREPFDKALLELDVRGDACVYVGDNPRCDFKGARAAGMATVRVRTGPFAGFTAGPEDDADSAVESIADVPRAVSELGAEIASSPT